MPTMGGHCALHWENWEVRMPAMGEHCRALKGRTSCQHPPSSHQDHPLTAEYVEVVVQLLCSSLPAREPSESRSATPWHDSLICSGDTRRACRENQGREMGGAAYSQCIWM